MSTEKEIRRKIEELFGCKWEEGEYNITIDPIPFLNSNTLQQISASKSVTTLTNFVKDSERKRIHEEIFEKLPAKIFNEVSVEYVKWYISLCVHVSLDINKVLEHEVLVNFQITPNVYDGYIQEGIIHKSEYLIGLGLRGRIPLLALSQGYTFEDLKSAILDGEYKGSEFLETLISEIKEIPAAELSSSVFVFPMKCSIGAAINLTANPETTYIYIPKGTRCGLVQYGQGGGGSFDVVLERDFLLTGDGAEFRFEVEPKYGLMDIFGVDESFWFDPKEYKSIQRRSSELRKLHTEIQNIIPFLGEEEDAIFRLIGYDRIEEIPKEQAIRLLEYVKLKKGGLVQ